MRRVTCIASALVLAAATHTSCPNLCRAPAGYEVAAGGDTVHLCPPNHFHNGTGTLCTQCPSPSSFSSQGGLQHITQCPCSAGYNRAGSECRACPVGTYKAESGDGQCTSCPPNTYTLFPASTSAAACVCAPGFQPDAGTCKKMLCASNRALVVSAHSASCQCTLGFGGTEDSSCAPCADGTYKDRVGDTRCASCGPHTVSVHPRANRTHCACAHAFEPDLWHGPDVVGGSCVPECAPGHERVDGLCVACARGYFKNVSEGHCTRCPAPLSSSAPGSKLASQCTCPRNMLEFDEDDIAIVQSLGAWKQDSVQIFTGINSLTRAQHTGNWHLQIQGSPSAVTVTVGGRLVFQCQHTCKHTTLDLHGMRGPLFAAESDPGALVHFTLLVKKQRA